MSKSDEVSQKSTSGGASKYIDGIHEERFDAFLSDLRSGKYIQGTGSLHTTIDNGDGTTTDRFCCLGVGCVRPAAEGVVSTVAPEKLTTEYGLDTSYNMQTADMPKAVGDYLGIPDSHRVDGKGSFNIPFFKMGYDRYDGCHYTAIGLNDTLGYTFGQIADAFEKEFTKED